MGKYIEMIRMRFLMMLAYRTNYYSGIFIYSINIGAYYFLWSAIYGGQPSIQGMTVEQMTTYVAIAWMARAFYFNNIDREIAMEIREGKVAIELIRPYNYLIMKTMQGLGEGIFRLLFFSLPGMIIVTFVFSLQFTANVHTWGYFALSTMFSFIINSQLNLIAGMVTFFTLNGEGLLRAKRFVIDLFSGLILPISFYPEWAQHVMHYLPFQAISYIPSMIFTESFTGDAVIKGMMFQAVWCVVLIVPIYVLWKAAKRKLIIQGG
ncbi:ABC transporter permease [Anoxybacillus ayderensis]|uniref:ABC transporter permease n=1 Tax=Anoxybacillus ayderensis TaxID=265546 RepID=UPI000A272898|nr:ABC-2 family transporter protein [Anoxybacillus ayderensis]MBA2879420.1 ABC-2 type transport system permease protein [Anoxybacillus ayderensis]MED0656911.1 ABC-2 family transporter protein [Anoxybacillus ayderensis]OSX53355.1 daunorubicin ABC transporter permease [Anoxybacillus ayderensis]